MYSLHNLSDGEGQVDTNGTGEIITKIPRASYASSEMLDNEGIYLLDDLDCLWLYIGRSVQHTFLEECFAIGAQVRSKCPSFNHTTEQGCKMLAIIENIRKLFPYKHELKV